MSKKFGRLPKKKRMERKAKKEREAERERERGKKEKRRDIIETAQSGLRTVAGSGGCLSIDFPFSLQAIPPQIREGTHTHTPRSRGARKEKQKGMDGIFDCGSIKRLDRPGGQTEWTCTHTKRGERVKGETRRASQKL